VRFLGCCCWFHNLIKHLENASLKQIAKTSAVGLLMISKLI
jgi:hypothetical protein